MEFRHGRERFYMTEEQDKTCKHAAFVPSSSFSSSPSSSAVPFRWNDGSSGGANNSFVEKEHMFDKVVTPSDVGKLNRLVIPKQHAERYFPLDAPSANGKGMLLSFEDRTGKSWRFRYSYWNSSQSYVMTKGWSRFVKEKRLDAGDTVSFGRGVDESGSGRLYIDWKRRPDTYDPARISRIPLHGASFTRPFVPWSGHHYMPRSGHHYMPPATATMYEHHGQGFGYNFSGTSAIEGQLLFFRSPVTGPPPNHVQPEGGGGGGSGSLSMVLDSVPVVHSQATAKRVRLFGVNLMCPDTETYAGGGREGTSLSFLRSQETSTVPLQLQHSSVESSLASSSPTSKELHSSLDLDL